MSSRAKVPMLSYGDPTAPVWFGRKVTAKPWPAEFIRAVTTPRADGMRTLTPPTGGDHELVGDLLVAGVGAVGLAGFLWWAFHG